MFADLKDKTMYSEELRCKLMFPNHYDNMIALIMMYNEYCNDEEWAIKTINLCIQGVLDGSNDFSTGMCMAKKGEGGIQLYLSPCNSHGVEKLGKAIRKSHSQPW